MRYGWRLVKDTLYPGADESVTIKKKKKSAKALLGPRYRNAENKGPKQCRDKEDMLLLKMQINLED